LDTISVLPFFGTVLIPFALAFEIVIIQWSGKKRILGIILSYLVLFIPLYFLHPAFKLAYNSFLIMIGFAILIFLIPITVIVYSNSRTFFRDLEVKIFGLHIKKLTETISRSTVLTNAFIYGLRNIRKRALRSLLVLSTVIIIAASLVSFVSIKSITIVRPILLGGGGNYDGIMIMHKEWGRIDYNFQPGVGDRLIQLLELCCSNQADVAPRSWIGSSYALRGDEIWNENYTRVSFMKSLLGVIVNDPIPLQLSLISGRWFMEEEKSSCVAIVSNFIAEELGITRLPSKIFIKGVEFTVIGIFDGEIFSSFNDLNNEPITPLDLTLSGIWTQHLSGRSIVIIPYETAIMWGAWPVSVSIKFHDPKFTNIKEIASLLSSVFYLNIVANFNNGTYLFTPEISYTVGGLNVQIPIIIIGAMNILSTLLAGVYERRKEIEIYASLGMSPFAVSFLFIAESAAYAILGASLGYLLGVMMGYVAITLYPEFLLEYGSSKILLSVLGVMLVTLASSSYPAFLASKLITPSLARKWKIPKPIDSQWFISFPFVANTEDDAKGILAYIDELVEGHAGESSEIFRTLTKSLIKKEEDERRALSLVFDVRLAPYELGVKTKVEFTVLQERDRKYYFSLSLLREEGSKSHWETHGKVFIDLIRKQILMWRGLPEEERIKYSLKGREIIV
jgi:ABC-type antimicrobial peptide transport system permease subunit